MWTRKQRQSVKVYDEKVFYHCSCPRCFIVPVLEPVLGATGVPGQFGPGVRRLEEDVGRCARQRAQGMEGSGAPRLWLLLAFLDPRTQQEPKLQPQRTAKALLLPRKAVLPDRRSLRLRRLRSLSGLVGVRWPRRAYPSAVQDGENRPPGASVIG